MTEWEGGGASRKCLLILLRSKNLQIIPDSLIDMLSFLRGEKYCSFGFSFLFFFLSELVKYVCCDIYVALLSKMHNSWQAWEYNR